MNLIQRLFYRVSKWLTPYKYAFEDEVFPKVESAQKVRKKKLKTKEKRKQKKEDKRSAKAYLDTGAIGIDLVTINNAMNENKALNRLSRSNAQVAYYYHDETYHQIAVKFEKGVSRKYQIRNEQKRKDLTPILEYKRKSNGDKTHIIPIGFHGSENDERLLVRFDAKINRGALKKEEEYLTKLNEEEPIMWYVSIVKQSDETAIWYMRVWDKNNNIISQKSFHDYHKFNF